MEENSCVLSTKVNKRAGSVGGDPVPLRPDPARGWGSVEVTLRVGCFCPTDPVESLRGGRLERYRVGRV